MTSPSPEQPGDAGGVSTTKATGKPVRGVKVLDVVEYTHHDHILGRPHTGVGVVVRTGADNESIAVRPLAGHHVEVDPADLTPITADDVG